MKKKIIWAILTVVAVVLIGVLTACSVTQGDAKVSDDYSKEQVDANMEEMRTSTGYKLTYQGDATGEDENSTETFSYGAKGDVYFFSSSETEVYYDLSAEDHADIYTKSNGTWSKTVKAYGDGYTKADAKAEISVEATTVSGYMTYYTDSEYSEADMKKGSGEVLGRACDTYTFGAKVLLVSFNYTFYVDKATGICLKWSVDGKVVGQNVGVNFECKAFDTNPTFTLPQVSEENTTYENAQNTENGNGGETVSVLPEIADTARKANELRLSTGFYIEYKVTANGETTTTIGVAAKGDVYYVAQDETERYYDLTEEATYDVYAKVDDVWTKTTYAYEDGETKATVTASLVANLGNLTLSADLTDETMVKTDATFLRRNAYQYVTEEKDLIQGYRHTVVVDVETGMLLKHEASISAAGYNASYGVECTAFATTYAIDLASLNAVEAE